MVTDRSARWGWTWAGPAAFTILAMVSRAIPRTSPTWLVTPEKHVDGNQTKAVLNITRYVSHDGNRQVCQVG